MSASASTIPTRPGPELLRQTVVIIGGSAGKLVPWRGNSADVASLVGLGRMQTQEYAALKSVAAWSVWFVNEDLLKLGLITPGISRWQSAGDPLHAEGHGFDRTEVRQTRLATGATTAPQVFDDACIRRLAGIARLPQDTDLTQFGESVRASVLHYVQAKARPSPNELRA